MTGICEPLQILDIGYYSIREDGEIDRRFDYGCLLDGNGRAVENPSYATAKYIDVWFDDLGNVRNSAGQLCDPAPEIWSFIQDDWASSEF